MDPRTQERVEQWDSRPFSGGYDGLSDLADADFSGAVTAAGTWLFMLNGRVVGVVDGAIEAFEAVSGTAYEAPDPALPLLCTMEEKGGETRAKYYTNDTPLREVDQTLQSGSFTGYIELSENVLSGDYYAVYYGGRRMAAAYIGNADRLLTGDEAFERAADEVGIYEVRDVEIDVTDVPGTEQEQERERDSSAGVGAGGTGETDAADSTGTATGTEIDTGPDTGSHTDRDEGASRPEPSTDPTESAIDSIDISGSDPDPEPTATGDDAASAPIDDVTIDDPSAAATADATRESEGDAADGAETTEPSGITATDDVDTDPEPPSSGITDTGADATDGTGAGTASETTIGSADGSTADRAQADSATASADDDRSTEATDAAARTGDDRSRSTARSDEQSTSTAEVSIDAGAASTETDDAEGASGSGPDPAEVEAAAQQLEQNDISWTEDDVAESPASSGESAASTESAATDTAATPTSGSEESAATDERFDEEAQWRETRSIPSIDPDNSQSSDGGDRNEATQRSQPRRSDAGAERSGRRESAARSETGNASNRRQAQQSGGTRQRGPQRTDAVDTASASAPSGRGGGQTGDDERVAELEERVEVLEEQRDKLAAKAEELEAERDRLQSENEELSSTVDRLRSRIEELEAELERAREAAESDASETASASTDLPPQRALAETNLFVRYASKSQPTLESARDGEGDRSDVAANLRLEHHTGFDASDVAVDGRPFGEFLTDTMEHRFVNWLTETLLFEIRDTGNADGLGDLYDAIPRIDRAELGATISLEEDDTDDVPDRVSFDVVAFDKMGNPLVVANINDSRDPATQEMLEEMEEAASAVKANYPDLAAAIVVTSSYFEPGALEVTEEATSAGLLSRGSKLSYVNLSRKTGYHLCLVESRSEGFHMNVPEL